jgi:AraC family transcriptional regulator
MKKSETLRDYRERILRVLVHIQTHLDEDLDLAFLARLAHFSPFHFHRVFRGMVGEPVKEHVRRLRMERAAVQLKSTEASITTIALSAGFETHEAFTRAFRARFGQAPSGFRHARRPSPWADAPGVHYASGGKIPSFEPLQSEMTTMEVRIENRPPVRVAFIRHTGPYTEVGETWQRFMGWAASRKLFGSMMRPFGVCHDDPEVTPPDKLRYDACIPVGDAFEPEGEVGVQDLLGGRYAVTTHKGPYEGLGQVYGTLMGQWLPAHDLEPAQAPCVEVYLNTPQNVPPADLITEVCVPLKGT